MLYFFVVVDRKQQIDRILFKNDRTNISLVSLCSKIDIKTPKKNMISSTKSQKQKNNVQNLGAAPNDINDLEHEIKQIKQETQPENTEFTELKNDGNVQADVLFYNWLIDYKIFSCMNWHHLFLSLTNILKYRCLCFLEYILLNIIIKYKH